MNFDNNDYLIIVFFVLGALLHGITGFGYPIVGTAIIAGFYELKVAVAMVVIPCIVLNLLMLRTGGSIWHNITHYGRAYFWLFATSFVGGIIGVKLLMLFSESYLKIFLGTVLLFYVATQYSQFKIKFKTDNTTMAIFGLVAGIVGGVTNAIVAFLMIYLLGTDRNKVEMVIINNISILITKIIQIVMLAPLIISFNQKQIWLLGVVLIISLFFVYIGSYIRGRLSQAIFNHSVAVMLLGLGIYALYQGMAIL